MTRADEVERAAFNKWWSGMAHPMNETSPKPITRSAFSAGYRAALPSPTVGGACQFCHESDFDLVGLKHHYESGHCEPYNATKGV